MFAKLYQLAKTLNLPLEYLPAINIEQVQTDSRKVKAGDLFIALIGDNFDGHSYITQAKKNGAIAILVSKPVASDLPTLLVDDTRLAFGKIAAWARQYYQPIVIAITGSNGKTSTKNMLGCIMAEVGKTLITQGNLNNDLGVPMTLCRLRKHHKYCVIELGANHVGEIDYLAELVQPDVAIITNAGDAHLGEFGSLTNLVTEKSKIYQHLKPTGIAIVNKDSPHYNYWQQCIINPFITFGQDADVTSTQIKHYKKHIDFLLNYEQKQHTICLNFIGIHQVENALAAAGGAIALKIPLKVIANGLEKATLESGRLTIHTLDKMILIDDTYNANPASMRGAIKTLSQYMGKKVLVLGLMAELGHDSKKQHKSIVAFAKKYHIDAIYSLEDTANYYGDEVVNFDNPNSLTQHLLTQHKIHNILIKGSRMAKMERIVQEIQYLLNLG